MPQPTGSVASAGSIGFRSLLPAEKSSILFILLAVVAVALSVLVVVHDTALVWATSGLVCLLALLAFLASRTIGLPEITDDIRNWTEPLGYPAVASELLAAAVAAVALRGRDRKARDPGDAGSPVG